MKRFFKNIWLFRKELASFYPFDSSYTLEFLRRAIKVTCKDIELRSNEVDESKNLKVYNMKRAVYLLDALIEDGHMIEKITEDELGYKLKIGSFKTEPIEGSGSYKLILNEDLTEEEISKNLNFYKHQIEVENRLHNELFDILKGSDKDDGKDIRTWWW